MYVVNAVKYKISKEERMKEYGYARVSSKDQNIDRQITALKTSGILEKNIFTDTVSGKDFNRPKYKQLVNRLQAKDIVFIKSIDRLGRDYDEIIEQWRYLTKIKDIDIVVLDFPLLDTRNQMNGITGKFIADLVLQVLSYVAQVERENTLQRQAEGIKEAKARGVKFGRPPLQLHDDFYEVLDLWCKHKISKRQASKKLCISRYTFSKWIECHIDSYKNKDNVNG